MPTRYVALALGIALIAGIVALGMNEPNTNLLATDSSLFGTIEIDGSSTVFPITQAVAEEFRKVHPNVQVPVGVSGTGGGFKRFVVGETHISNASRSIKPIEIAAAAENGVEFIEIAIGFDGLSIITNPVNDFLECLTTDELRALWEPGSEVNRWRDVRDGLPASEFRLYGPDTDSGTFDYFTESIVHLEDASRSDYSASADDNVLIRGVSGDKDALGYFGYAFYSSSPDKLKLIAIDSGSGCIYPSPKTINDGTYSPLSRPMFIYVNTAALEREEVVVFLNFYLDNATTLVEEVGYVSLPETMYDDGRVLVASSAGSSN
ncbi:MAG TPA: PstS family phosphate ABC transporter substrate-binding protein [Dehalococcoidia bacterium]|nr:PstS family phosphate ABC transporter substrate-binding protein [Dehalococcoidia bacterium]